MSFGLDWRQVLDVNVRAIVDRIPLCDECAGGGHVTACLDDTETLSTCDGCCKTCAKEVAAAAAALAAKRETTCPKE